jgi:hypothetical protein
MSERKWNVTVACILCGKDRQCILGHVHVDGTADHTLAGWCEECVKLAELGETTILEGIATMFPGRVKIQKELTRTSHGDCPGCYGDVLANTKTEGW